MPNDKKKGGDTTGGASIKPLGAVPAAFAPLGAKINELVAAVNGQHFTPTGPLRIVNGTHGKKLSIDHQELSQNLYNANTNVLGAGGGGGTTLAVTICSNGSPATYNFYIQ